MTKIEDRTIRQWKLLFRTEKDVIERFLSLVNDLEEAIGQVEPVPQRLLQDLVFAKSRYSDWLTTPSEGTNMFLAPAVIAAAKSAKTLLGVDKSVESFRICNAFGEMCKILVSRRRDKYQELFEDLLVLASFAISDSWRIDLSGQSDDDDIGEISHLSTHMDIIIGQTALGYFFHSKSGEFTRSGKPDIALGQQIVNNALARHFDRQIRHLLQNDRPRVKEYVRTNMPFVYRMDLPDEWAGEKRKEWKRLLEDAGYEDVIRLLDDMGDLLNADEVGRVNPERRDGIIRAATNNDTERVSSLLAESAKELKSFLYKEAQDRLHYRSPAFPALPPGEARGAFARVQKLAKTDDPDNMRQALHLAQGIWQNNINNLELRDWVAYLQAKTQNLQAAEQMLEQIQRKRSPKRNFFTEWNLAVLAYDRKDEAATYELLVPLLDDGSLDEDLILVILALSLKLGDEDRFLEIVPQTMSLRFHPLAIVVAHQRKDKERVANLLAQLLRQWQGNWELPPVHLRFDSFDDFEQTVNKAIVEGQTTQLAVWLEARIKHNKNWVPNYLALTRVLEEEVQDIDGAFSVLRSRYNLVRKKGDERTVSDACRDILDFCKRTKRNDLGQQAYQLAKNAKITDDLLRSFSVFDPKPIQAIDSVKQSLDESPFTETRRLSEKRSEVTPRDPKLTERLAWANAQLASIRNSSSYLEQYQAIEEFGNIISEVSPQESVTVVDLIKNITTVIETFSRTAIEDRDSRRVLYDRATDYEKRLNQVLQGGILSQHVADIVTPYRQALKQVVGDLSRQAGIGPDIDAHIENPFISLEGSRSTVVLRVTNKSQRAVSDVFLEFLVEDTSLSVIGSRDRRIDRLLANQSHLFNFPISQGDSFGLSAPTELSFRISLRASAEGFPNVDLGIKKQLVPVKSLLDAVGQPFIPKLFQPGQPLSPMDPGLFQGRKEVLDLIRGSFYGGIQRERLFLDGIRRVGKTSILNFLPDHLPANLIPVRINFDKLTTSGPINSPSVLYSFATSIAVSVAMSTELTLDVPPESMFENTPGQTFEAFLSDIQKALPGRVPLLMIDEFQDLLKAIARTGSKDNRDTVVVDQLRAQLEEGRLNALFTGSIRFDRLSEIIDHRIFGSLRRMRVSFLSEDGVGSVLRAGLGEWVKVPPETIRRVFDLTGGYPWLAQTYGSGLVDLINQEHRSVVTPSDVDQVTTDSVISDKELFTFWWPPEQLGIEEERFVERLFRKYDHDQNVSIREFISDIHSVQQPAFKRALENLRACEVFDSTQNEHLKFRGTVLRSWLEQQMQDGQLRIRPVPSESEVYRGQAGIFVDHENLVKGLERIATRRGIEIPQDRVTWFAIILGNLLEEAEHRVGPLSHKIAVAFWSRPNEARLVTPYYTAGFDTKQPEEIKMENAVDFKVADEVRRAREKAMKENDLLSRAIIVSGDGDLSHAARALINDGVAVQVWGGSADTGSKYINIVGEKNFVALDDVCGL